MPRPMAPTPTEASDAAKAAKCSCAWVGRRAMQRRRRWMTRMLRRRQRMEVVNSKAEPQKGLLPYLPDLQVSVQLSLSFIEVLW